MIQVYMRTCKMRYTCKYSVHNAHVQNVLNMKIQCTLKSKWLMEQTITADDEHIQEQCIDTKKQIELFKSKSRKETDVKSKTVKFLYLLSIVERYSIGWQQSETH